MAHVESNSGSIWRRWDPHIHTPETLLNDQFKGQDPWNNFFDALENASPSIEAIGITDYYRLATYEKTIDAKHKGRLQNFPLIFPNIEMRLAIAAKKSRPINFHLLIAPDDPQHVSKAKRFLDRLEFKFQSETYSCKEDDLIALGRAHDKQCSTDSKAHQIGVNQFKVEIDQFIEKWEGSDWIQNNALIAVAASYKDGASSFQKNASLAALRKKIERIAHIMFTANPSDRAFWLGQSLQTKSEIREHYGALKPCLHGSDAHNPNDVGVPVKDRYSWIKGDATFDALRHACMEPELRVFIGSAPPSPAPPSCSIKTVSVNNAPWFSPGTVSLNPGLVGIIGAKGSGKTALVDMIAAGGYSLSGHMNERSFVKRANEYFTDDTAQLVWRDGEETSNQLRRNMDSKGIPADPHVQYLSQQFVETLCSADGPTGELISEIERVVFAAHSPEERQGTTSFRELMDAKTALSRQQRTAFEQGILQIGNLLAQERGKRDQLEVLQAKATGLTNAIKRDEKTKSQLVTSDGTAEAEAFDRVSNAEASVRQKVSQLKKREDILILLQAYIDQRRTKTATAELRSLRVEYADALLNNNEWKMFATDFVGDVDNLIKQKLDDVQKTIAALIGPPLETPPDRESNESPVPSQETLLPPDTKLEDIPLNFLIAEVTRLQALIGEDKQKRTLFTRLAQRIGTTKTDLSKLEQTIKDAEDAKDRISNLLDERNTDYAGVFKAILSEEATLKELYQPLSGQLLADHGAVAKLSVSIKRHIDVAGWAGRGEGLLDLRKADGFRGRGSLLQIAEEELRAPWEKGSAEDVAEAMARFRKDHGNKFVNASPYDRNTDLSSYRKWTKELSQWIYDTDHIRVGYSLQFEGVDIEQLSPGTRGIVLLLLYLGIDQEDERPLIIDQPEENLDPKSIFDELVDRFRRSKSRRQIIIVTHNANLVVNTDADQVIIATCGPHRRGNLPKINYQSGGLEDPTIRKHICDIMEGGENAFRERAKRLRVKGWNR